MFVVENFFHTRDAAHLWGFEGRLPHVLGRQGVVGPPTDRGSQEPGFWDLFDLEFRSMEGEGEIGDWPAFRESGPGGGAEGWGLGAGGLGGLEARAPGVRKGQGGQVEGGQGGEGQGANWRWPASPCGRSRSRCLGAGWRRSRGGSRHPYSRPSGGWRLLLDVAGGGGRGSPRPSPGLGGGRGAGKERRAESRERREQRAQRAAQWFR